MRELPTTIMKRLFKLYVVTGLLVGLFAWSIDSANTSNELFAVPLIAAIWPLWVLLYMFFG